MQPSSIVAVACAQGVAFAIPPHTASAGDELLCRDEWEFVETFKVSGCRPGQLVLRLLSVADHEVCDVTAGFLSHHWWSEMLMTKWSSLLFWAAFDLLQATAKEVPSRVGICRMVGHASRHVERRHRLVRVKVLTRLLRFFGVRFASNLPVKCHLALRIRLRLCSPLQGRLTRSSERGCIQMNPEGMQQPSWRHGWWMPRDAVDSTAGWSQAWVVFSCADEPLVNMLSCDPLIEEASRSPRVFVATRHPGEMHRLKKLPFVEVMSVEKAAEFANAAHWQTERCFRGSVVESTDGGDAVRPTPSEQLSLPIPMTRSAVPPADQDALTQLWDLDRWLLHRETAPGSRSSWDIAWVPEDGFSPGAALLPCETSKSQGAGVKWLVPKARFAEFAVHAVMFCSVAAWRMA
eukprot:s6006_g3.t1